MAHTEDSLVQTTTADYLHKDLLWDESVYAMHEVLGKEGTLGRESETEMVLTRYLGEKLMAFNPGLPMEAYQDAIRTLTATSSSAITLATNREKDTLHKNGVEVTYRNAKGERLKKRLRLFDFENPENNHFLVVREFWVKGDIYRRRADVVGFVNGIPLVFMELKNLHRDIKAAYEENLADYKDTIPHLFHHNAFIILGNGVEAKIGSLSSQFEHFNDWKRLSEGDAGVVEMETLLKGTCSKTALLDLFENFILFDDSTGKLIKIIARNHQFLGVNRAIARVSEHQKRAGKLGVFWHTQGSGKSYSIVFFARKVHRRLGGNYTFLVLTDRDDLDTQLYKTFAGCGVVDHDKDPCRASSGEHLQQLLREQKAYVFSLVQKFNQKIEPDAPYTQRDDIIVITDEAHRTQYGLLSLNMRNALPNASFIGFTGTPLFADDEITQEVFGEYVSTYDFQRAVEDKSTVPLYYDARGEKLVFKDESGTQHCVADPKGLNEKIAAKLAELEIDDIDVQQRLERELKRDYHLITSSSRLGQIADDFVQHYSQGWETGKAMLVCIDKITCVRMHRLIQDAWEQHTRKLAKQVSYASDEQDLVWRTRQLAWMQETQIAVVVSEEQGEVAKFAAWNLDITPHRRLIKEGFTQADGKQLDMESAFKRAEHPFRVAIVCAMWLTGFDVPSLATLYLDKPLKAHTLMQAIARANRVAEGKTNGLIVDYCGILKNLRKALATFAGRKVDGDGDETDPARPKEELLKTLAEAIGMARDFLQQRGFALASIDEAQGFAKNKAIRDAKEAVNENDHTRKQFEIMARAVLNTFKACITIPGVNAYREARDAVNIIYKSLQADTQRADISAILRELHHLVDQAIDTSGVRDQPRPDTPETASIYDISQIDFDLLRREFAASKQPRTTVQSLKSAIEQQLQRLLMQNPLRTNFQDHYEQLVKTYNQEKDRATIEQTFEALVKLVNALSEEEKRAQREHMDEETLALFDLLEKPDLKSKERERIKQVAAELLETLKAERLRIANWRDKEATRDAVRQQIYDFLYDENTGLPVNDYSVDEIPVLRERVFQHVYRTYPTLPSPYFQA
ncbi:type I restriction endonuclease subunit R [Thiothrix litoralis]|uniref:Type I restriction enzyme endonuclease subunit n=1 Tax=Thiothrix litoralis TaxID=2891210 RepID=A0ABX7WP40_9GAMM|nr:type I restriction endonuclease subunit R [Thiothrix litoralis]QTR45596.1 type I restriction endonuclease subunit R [Thiothrix litoralis]